MLSFLLPCLYARVFLQTLLPVQTADRKFHQHCEAAKNSGWRISAPQLSQALVRFLLQADMFFVGKALGDYRRAFFPFFSLEPAGPIKAYIGQRSIYSVRKSPQSKSEIQQITSASLSLA